MPLPPLTAEQREQLATVAGELFEQKTTQPFEIVYRILADHVLALVRLQWNDRDDIDPDDAVMEAFAQLWTAVRGDWKGERTADALWVFLVNAVHRVFIDARRRARSRREECSLGPADEALADDSLASAPALSADLLQLKLEQVLSSLADDDKLVLELLLKGLTPESFAERKLRRALDKIRSELLREGPIAVWHKDLLHNNLLLDPRESLRNSSGDLSGRKIAPALRGIEKRRRSKPRPKSDRLDTENIVDPVDCTVFAPRAVSPGAEFLLQVFAHTPKQADQASSLARQFDDEATARGYTSLETEVARGSKLFFHLQMPGAKIDAPVKSLVWQGRAASCQFRVKLPAGFRAKSLLGTVIVSEGDAPLGEISFKLKVQRGGAEEPSLTLPTGEARRFDLFFVSYASQDRPEVLKRLQGIARVGKRFFQDLLSLDPGDRWKQKLYKHIDECDAVLLFWSTHAKKSRWVMKECAYAIEKKGIERLLPVVIEGPPPVKPPKALADLHMNDWLLYIMEADSRSREK